MKTIDSKGKKGIANGKAAARLVAARMVPLPDIQAGLNTALRMAAESTAELHARPEWRRIMRAVGEVLPDAKALLEKGDVEIATVAEIFRCPPECRDAAAAGVLYPEFQSRPMHPAQARQFLREMVIIPAERKAAWDRGKEKRMAVWRHRLADSRKWWEADGDMQDKPLVVDHSGWDEKLPNGHYVDATSANWCGKFGARAIVVPLEKFGFLFKGGTDSPSIYHGAGDEPASGCVVNLEPIMHAVAEAAESSHGHEWGQSFSARESAIIAGAPATVPPARAPARKARPGRLDAAGRSWMVDPFMDTLPGNAGDIVARYPGAVAVGRLSPQSLHALELLVAMPNDSGAATWWRTDGAGTWHECPTGPGKAAGVQRAFLQSIRRFHGWKIATGTAESSGRNGFQTAGRRAWENWEHGRPMAHHTLCKVIRLARGMSPGAKTASDDNGTA